MAGDAGCSGGCVSGKFRRFGSGVKNCRVIKLHDTNHYVLIVDAALGVRETRKFLLDERNVAHVVTISARK